MPNILRAIVDTDHVVSERDRFANSRRLEEPRTQYHDPFGMLVARHCIGVSAGCSL